MPPCLKRLLFGLGIACALLGVPAPSSLAAEPLPHAIAPQSRFLPPAVPDAGNVAAVSNEPPGRSSRLPPVDVVQQVAFLQAQGLQDSGLDDRFGMLGLAFQEYQDRRLEPLGFPRGKPLLVIGGQVQIDSVYWGQDPESMLAVGDLQDGVDFRRARIIAQGISNEVYRYVFGVDFALAGRPSFLDVYIEHAELPVLQHARVGHFFEPFSLERITQNRNNTFMERSLVDTFAPARNTGAMVYGNTPGEFATWQIGTFRTGSDNWGNDSFDSGQALTMRATCAPYYDEESDGAYYMHLGACYSYRNAYQKEVRFRNSPEIRLQEPGAPSNFGPIFVDTGFIPADRFQLFDAEFAWTHNSLSVQSEYAFATVDQIGGPGLFFDGYMVQVSYFLTGEHRPYDRKLGIHRRVIPFTNFVGFLAPNKDVPMGTGAWEIAARFSMIRLTNQNILGNDLTDFTFGVNWYWNPYTRTRFNYIRAFLDDPIAGRSVTNIFGIRMDFEF